MSKRGGHPAWSEAEITLMRERYADLSSPEVSKLVGRSLGAVKRRAVLMGLKKSKERRAQMNRKGAPRIERGLR